VFKIFPRAGFLKKNFLDYKKMMGPRVILTPTPTWTGVEGRLSRRSPKKRRINESGESKAGDYCLICERHYTFSSVNGFLKLN
jgi:hypothetical protein